MNPSGYFSGSWSYFPDAPKELKAGEDLFKHQRKPHNSKHTEPLCKECRERKIRGKCRTQGCKRKGK